MCDDPFEKQVNNQALTNRDKFKASAFKSQQQHGTGKPIMKDRHIGEVGGTAARGEKDISASVNPVTKIIYKRNMGKSEENIGYFKPSTNKPELCDGSVFSNVLRRKSSRTQ